MRGPLASRTNHTSSFECVSSPGPATRSRERMTSSGRVVASTSSRPRSIKRVRRSALYDKTACGDFAQRQAGVRVLSRSRSAGLSWLAVQHDKHLQLRISAARCGFIGMEPHRKPRSISLERQTVLRAPSPRLLVRGQPARAVSRPLACSPEGNLSPNSSHLGRSAHSVLSGLLPGFPGKQMRQVPLWVGRRPTGEGEDAQCRTLSGQWVRPQNSGSK